MKYYLVLLFSAFTLCGYSQVAFKGKVIDETGEALPFANLTLFLLPDTATVKYYSITDLQGTFTVENVEVGSYLCNLSYIGYETIHDTLQVANLQTVFERSYQMKPASNLVSEVVVTGSKQTVSTGKLSYLITEKERQGKTSAFDMMNLLPNILINRLTQSISSASGGSVMILINGLSSNATDLLALQPEDILRIEHYEVPPTRYVNYDSVVNVVTKPRTTGWTAAAGVDHAFTTGFGNDYLRLSFFKGQHQFSLNYNLHYRNYTDRQYNRLYEYDFQNSHYVNSREGRDKFGYDAHSINLTYLYQADKTVIRAKFTPTYMGVHSDGNEDVELKKDAVTELRTNTKWRRSSEFNPVLDLYAQHKLTDKDEFALNVVGTGFFTDNKYRNQEREVESGELKLNEDVREDNRKYSLIGEAWYSHKWNDVHTLNVGYQLETYRLNSKVDNTFGYNDFITDYRQHYGYAELVGNSGKWGYVLSAGVVQKHTASIANRYSSWLFRPSLTLQYNLEKGQLLRLRFIRQNSEPSISSLSDNKTYITDEIISMGNPYLRNQTGNSLQLTYGLNLPWMNLQLNPFFSYIQSPLNSYFSYSDAENMIVQQTENGVRNRMYGFTYSLRVIPFKSNYVTVGVSGSLYKENIKTRTVGTIAHLNHPLRGYMQLTYKDWSLYYQGVLVTYSLNGSYYSATENYSEISLGYNRKNWSVSASCYWPFTRSKYHTYSIDQSIVKYDARTRINDNASMFTLGFTLFLNKGKTYQAKSAVLQNSDGDSGSFY
ncbi:MAG: outer membrane beta-barrel protein [Mediterranea sp.]|jgi:hypothetical protein|nr:outer membrane beta-barrel protein [Mediterranea sp.]